MIDIRENDFYKLSDVNPNAIHAEALDTSEHQTSEIYSNINIVGTTNVFQTMKFTYQTLYNEKRRIKYDTDTNFDKDDDNDQIAFAIENNQIR